MSASTEASSLFGNTPRLAALRETQKPDDKDNETDASEASCPAFGYLRGLDQRALAVEFRFRDGNSDWYSYGLLSNWRYNPAVGLLLKFTSDVTTLALIRGSNLDALVGDKAINLTDRGFQRHRILWVREMGEGELRQLGEGGPTIDKIDIADLEDNSDLREWVKRQAP